MTSSNFSGGQRPVYLVSVGRAVGRREVKNDELSRLCGIPAPAIEALTGIRSRSYAPFEETEELGFRATEDLLSRLPSGEGAPGILLLATTTPASHIPATAMRLHRRLFPKGGPPAVDVGGSCAAFMTGLFTARSLVASGAFESVLLVNAEKKTDHLCPVHAPETALLFGDGASAAWISARPPAGRTVLRLSRLRIGADGAGASLVTYAPDPASGRKILRMDGGGLFKKAVRTLSRELARLMEEEALSSEEVGALFLHQANRRIMDATAKRVGIPQERLYVNVDQYGNTSAASIPIALDEARRKGRLKEGDVVVMVAFGAGFTWASAAVRM